MLPFDFRKRGKRDLRRLPEPLAAGAALGGFFAVIWGVGLGINELLASIPLIGATIPSISSQAEVVSNAFSQLWNVTGWNVLLYLMILNIIPRSVYEAAQLDGAGPWAQFRFITFPLLSPTTLFIAVTTVLASFQLFGQTLVITGGGPTRSTQSVIQYITEEAFGNNQQSSAAAMAFLFGALMLIFTGFQFRLMAKDLRSSGKDG